MKFLEGRNKPNDSEFLKRNHGGQRKWHNNFQRAERVDLSTQNFVSGYNFSLTNKG